MTEQNSTEQNVADKVLFDVDRYGVATVTLNNPDKHNAFDDEIIGQLTHIFMDIAKRSDIRVMVLASTGKSFSAGADLGWMKRMASYSLEENLKDANALALMLKALNFLPQPTIAKNSRVCIWRRCWLSELL